MGKLDGKIAIITGCSAGIGKQLAIKFAEEGAKLAICARRLEKLEETAKICEERGAEVLCVQADVSLEEDLNNLVDSTVGRFGTVDILVNNAQGGLPGGQSSQATFLDTPLESFEVFMHASVYAPVILMKRCFPHMKGKQDASIINFSSGASTGMRGTGSMRSAYGTAKGALSTLSRIVADEWGQYGIRVNIIYPEVSTDTMEEKADAYGYRDKWLPLMADNPMKRAGDPYLDCAPVAVFLASEDSRFLTGQAIYVAGGHWMAI